MKVEITGEVIAELVDEYLRERSAPDINDWREVLDSVREQSLTGHVAGRQYWVDLYSERQRNAVAMNSGMADSLAELTADLSGHPADCVALVLIERNDHGYFVWLSEDVKSVVSLLRAQSRRTLS